MEEQFDRWNTANLDLEFHRLHHVLFGTAFTEAITLDESTIPERAAIMRRIKAIENEYRRRFASLSLQVQGQRSGRASND